MRPRPHRLRRLRQILHAPRLPQPIIPQNAENPPVQRINGSQFGAVAVKQLPALRHRPALILVDELPPGVKLVGPHFPFRQRLPGGVQRLQAPVGSGRQRRQQVGRLVAAVLRHPLGQRHYRLLRIIRQPDNGHRHHREPLLVEMHQIPLHLPRFLPLADGLQAFGVVGLHPQVQHLDIGVQQGVGQLVVLPDFRPRLADHIHRIGAPAPPLQPFQPLVAELHRPQRRRMQVVRDEHIEPPVAPGVNQPVRRQPFQLFQPLVLRLPTDEPVAQKLLNDLAVGAVFGAAPHRFQHAPGHRVGRRKPPNGAEIRQLHKIGRHQPLAPGLHQMPVPHKGNASHPFQVGVFAVIPPGQQNVAQLPDDVLPFPVDDDIKTALGNGLLRQRAHLRPPAQDDELRVMLAGLPGDFVGARRLVNQRRNHQDVHAVQVGVRIHMPQPVLKPDVPLVNVGPRPLRQRAGEKQHSLPGDGDVLKIAARRSRLHHQHPPRAAPPRLNGHRGHRGRGAVVLLLEQLNDAHFGSPTPISSAGRTGATATIMRPARKLPAIIQHKTPNAPTRNPLATPQFGGCPDLADAPTWRMPRLGECPDLANAPTLPMPLSVERPHFAERTDGAAAAAAAPYLASRSKSPTSSGSSSATIRRT